MIWKRGSHSQNKAIIYAKRSYIIQNKLDFERPIISCGRKLDSNFRETCIIWRKSNRFNWKMTLILSKMSNF